MLTLRSASFRSRSETESAGAGRCAGDAAGDAACAAADFLVAAEQVADARGGVLRLLLYLSAEGDSGLGSAPVSSSSSKGTTLLRRPHVDGRLSSTAGFESVGDDVRAWFASFLWGVTR